MSRYGFTPSFKTPGNGVRLGTPGDTTLSVIVGWDNPLQTFFGDVENANGDEIVSTMLGMGELDVQYVDDLEYLIGYVIPADIKDKLEADQGQRTEPTDLQRKMAGLFQR